MRSNKPTTHAGIDVGGKELVVKLARGKAEAVTLTIPNDPEGHRTVLRALTKKAGTARVVLEATGTHHLDLALHLGACPRIELMVVNPLVARRFAQAQMRRAKTDKVDAGVLLEFAIRMAFTAWVPPRAVVLEFRAVCRHLSALIADQTVIKNRLAAARTTATTPAFILTELEEELTALEGRIQRAVEEAWRVAQTDADLLAAVENLDTMPGIARRTALQLVAELVVLDGEMSPDQVVAHAGLDPRPSQSGTRGNNVAGRRISKVGNARVRGILYMSALTACRDAGPIRDFYERLRARNKVPFVAHVAAMRRMLRVAWVLMQTKTTWDPSLFAPRAAPARSTKVTNGSEMNCAPAP